MIEDSNLAEQLALDCEKIFEITKEDGSDILLKKRKRSSCFCFNLVHLIVICSFKI